MQRVSDEELSGIGSQIQLKRQHMDFTIWRFLWSIQAMEVMDL